MVNSSYICEALCITTHPHAQGERKHVDIFLIGRILLVRSQIQGLPIVGLLCGSDMPVTKNIISGLKFAFSAFEIETLGEQGILNDVQPHFKLVHLGNCVYLSC